MRRPTKDPVLRSEDVIYFAITGKIRIHLAYFDDEVVVGEDFQGGTHLKFRPLGGRRPSARRAAAAFN